MAIAFKEKIAFDLQSLSSVSVMNFLCVLIACLDVPIE